MSALRVFPVVSTHACGLDSQRMFWSSERRIPGLLLRLLPHYVTVKATELVAVPPGVVIAILPVFAPVGTVAVTCVSEFMVKLVAATPPNVTFVV